MLKNSFAWAIISLVKLTIPGRQAGLPQALKRWFGSGYEINIKISEKSFGNILPFYGLPCAGGGCRPYAAYIYVSHCG